MSEISDQFQSNVDSEWGWRARLNLVGTNTSACLHITTTRLALCRLSKNTRVEGSLWLDNGRQARKGGLFDIAENSFVRAEEIYRSIQSSTDLHEVKFQQAKIKHALGKSTEALMMVNQDEFHDLLRTVTEDSMEKVVTSLEQEGRLKHLVRCALQATEWMVESGLKSGSEVKSRYKLLTELCPDWERGENGFVYFAIIFNIRHRAKLFLLKHTINLQDIYTQCWTRGSMC